MSNRNRLHPNPKHPFLLLVLALGILVFSPVFAAGGGGGGFNAPSQSAPSIDPVAKYQEGIAAIKEGDNKAAAKAFKKVLRVNRKHAGSHYFLGLALFNQDKFKKSSKPFKKALKYDSSLFSAHGYLGVVYLRTNKVAKADEQLNILSRQQKACGECADKKKINQAIALIEQQKLTDKTQSFIDVDVDLKQGDRSYIDAVALINQQDYQAALIALARSAVILGPHPDVLTYQGFANRKLGNLDLAFSYYQAALKVDDEHRGANEYLGEFYVETQRLSLAQAQLDKLESICTFGCEEADELRRWIFDAS